MSARKQQIIYIYQSLFITNRQIKIYLYYIYIYIFMYICICVCVCVCVCILFRGITLFDREGDKKIPLFH